jgi:hypothetical protein
MKTVHFSKWTVLTTKGNENEERKFFRNPHVVIRDSYRLRWSDGLVD